MRQVNTIANLTIHLTIMKNEIERLEKIKILISNTLKIINISTKTLPKNLSGIIPILIMIYSFLTEDKY